MPSGLLKSVTDKGEGKREKGEGRTLEVPGNEYFSLLPSPLTPTSF
jgi:hypothetical protein